MTSGWLLWALLATTWTAAAAGTLQQQQQRFERLGGPADDWLGASGELTGRFPFDLPSFPSFPSFQATASVSSNSQKQQQQQQQQQPRRSDPLVDVGLRPRPREDRARCSDACQMVVGVPAYADVPADSSRVQKTCGSRLQATSLFLCLRVYCGGYHGAAGIERLNHTCTVYVGQPLPPYGDLADGYSDEVIAGLRRLHQEDIESFPPANISEVVVPTEALHQNGYDTLDDWIYVHKYHLAYSGIMLLYWIFVVAFGVCSRLVFAVTRAFRRLFSRGTGSCTITVTGTGYQPLASRVPNGLDADEAALEAKGPPSRSGRPRIWLRRYVTLPAAFGYRCAQDFGWYTVPPRVQSLTISVFVLINILACVQGYRTFSGNLYYPQVRDQLYRYVSDRTGIVSYANFPLIWLFGMRNNALLWLTGWDFGAFNNFHRWVARAATVQAIIHSVGYTLLMCRNDGLAAFFEWWAIFFWWTGGVATICMSLLLGFSLYWMRRRVYEAFLVLHIVLSILVLAGMLGHVSIFHGRFDGFVWLCTIIWVGDRVVRSLRILAFNPLFWNTRAKATYDPRSNIVRLVIPYASSLYQPRPGTYYYIHVLNDCRFWESHPFTVASVAQRQPRQCSSPAQVELDEQAEPTPPLPLPFPSPLPYSQQLDAALAETTESSTLLRSDESSSAFGSTGSLSTGRCSSTGSRGAGSKIGSTIPAPAHTAPAMTFLIRPYDGFTARLRDKAAVSWPRPSSLRVLVDGPYGHSQHFDDFDTVLFVVGGSGIVVPLSHLSGIGHPPNVTADAFSASASASASAFASASASASASAAGSGSKSNSSRLRSVRIVWAAREASMAADIIREDFDGLLEGDSNISLDVFITKPSQQLEAVQAGDSDDESHDDDDDELHSASRQLRGPSAPGEPLPKKVRLLSGRPDVRGEIECAMKSAAVGGRLAVVACGPARMADDARRAVVDLLGTRGTGDVEYFEESFQW